MSQKIVLNSTHAIRRAIEFLSSLNPEHTMQIEISKWRSPRTLSANALYWQWMSCLAAHVGTQGKLYSKDDLHDICRHKFLGYRSAGGRLADGSALSPQLKSTTGLTKGDMCHYMTQVDAWAVSIGCLLSYPDDSEYKKYAEMQTE